MKRITLLFFTLLYWCSYSQLANESFETWPAPGWHIMNEAGLNITWDHSQAGNPDHPHTGDFAAYLNREISGTGITEDWLVTPGFPAPANAQVRFWSRLTIGGNQGTIYEVWVSTTSQTDPDQFTLVQSWTETEINPSQETYTEKLVSLTGIPAGQQIYVAFVMRGTGPNGDRWLVDDVSVNEKCLDPTALTAGNITQTTADLSWGNPSGATSWEVEVVPAAAAPTGTGVVYNGTLPYTAPGLTEDTDYKYYVRARCTTINKSEWIGPFNFSTVPTGATCSAPIIIGTLPFSATGNTSNFGDDFDGTPGATGCGTTGNFLNGDEVVYAYTAAFTGVVSINMTGNGANSAMFVYNSCANIGVSCVAGGTGNATTPVNLPSVSVTAGTTYYIVISSSTTQSTPYNIVIQQVNCPPPTNLGAGNITSSSANLTWSTNAASSWQVVVQAQGAGIPSGAGTTTTVNTNYNVTQTTAGVPLAPATQYEYYVRADCGTGDGTFSAWTGPYLFTTLCTSLNLPFSEGFNSTSPTQMCWTVLNLNGDGDAWNMDYGTNPFEGNQSAMLYTDFNNGNNNDWLISPTINLTGNQRLRYRYRVESAGEPDAFEVLLSTAGIDPTSFTTTLVPLATYGNTTYAEVIVNLLNAGTPISGPVNIAWHVPSGGPDGWRIYIDNVIIEDIPSCPDPTNLAVLNSTTTTAQLSWTAGFNESAWQVVVQPQGTGAPTATSTIIDAPSNPFTVTGLNASTQYEYYVRANCAADDQSNWVGPFNFTTQCDAFNVPFFEGFNSTSTSEFCWTVLNSNGDGDQWDMNYATNPFEGNQAAMLYTDFNNGNNNDWLISPTINLTGNQRLRYRYRVQSGGEPDAFEVLLSTTGINPANFTTTIVPLATYGNTTYVEVIVNLLNAGTPISGPVNIAWHVPGGGPDGWRIYIDNVIVEDIPTCPDPTNLAVLGSTTTTAELSWNAGFNETAWQVVVQPQGTGAPTAASIIVDAPSNPFTITGLNPSTQYEYYVRANCAADDQSNWVGPFNFTTQCDAFDVPFFEGFNSTSTSEFCWTVLNSNGDGDQWDMNYGFNAFEGNQSAMLYTDFNNGNNNDWLISPTINLTGNQRLRYRYRVQSGGEPDAFEVLLSTGGIAPANFTTTIVPLATYGNTTYVEVIVNLIDAGTPISGPVNIAWHVPGGGPDGWRIYIDNVIVEDIPTCPDPTNLAVIGTTSTTADLEWDPGYLETAWQVVVQPEGTGAPTATSTILDAATNPYTATGLAPYTEYEYYVRANCAADDQSNWVGPFVFTTSIGNDDCEGAAVLPVNPTADCVQFVPATFTGANVSAQANSCTGVNGGDIWFEFTATNAAHDISLSNFEGTAQAIVLSLYEGDQCGALTNISCSYTNVINATGLVIGTTYKVRAAINEASPAFDTSFDVCVSTPPPPANSNQTECIITTINFDFELPEPPAPTIYPHFVSHHVVQGWRTTASDEQMEFWSAPNYENVPAYSGDQFIELNANLVSGVYQDYQTPQPTVFSYAFAHRGRQGTDTCQLLAGPPGGPYVPVTTATTGNTAWVYYTGNYTVPAGQTVTRFIFQSVSSVGGVSVGNYLDAITFTANNGLLSENPMPLDCTNNIANVSAAGVGTWSAHGDNPGATTIGNTSDNDTTISGFSVSGTYRYDWTTQYCTSTLEITFDSGNITPPVTANIEYCQNETALPLTAEAQTGYTLNWYAAETGGTPLAGAPTPDTGTAGDVIYYVSQSSAQGCESTRAAITVTVNELPPVPLADDMSYCVGAIASQLTATPLAGNTLNWYASATEETPLTEAPTPLTDTEGTFTYYVSQQTAEGCESAREEIIVSVNWNNSATPVTEFDFETTYCFDATGAQPVLAPGFTAGGLFTASNGLPIDPATGEVNFASVTPGIYTITYTVGPDLTLCNPGGSFSDTFTISSENIFTLQGDCQGSEYIIVPVDDLEGASYEWFDANGVPVGSEREFNVSAYVNSTPHEDVFPLDFELILTINGCESTGTHTVDGISCIIQKGISPNSDGLNDSFDLSFMNVINLSIFNRYGQEVFSYSNYTNQWGGQDKSGNKLPTGTYYYSFERSNGETKTGWIYVNRED